MMRYGWLVDVILALHFGYIAFLVLGGFLAWRWAKVFWLHLAACIWAVLIVLEWVDCPLTAAENWARQKAGQAPLTAGFIDRYLTNVVYPPQYINEVRLLVALVVVVAWIGAFRLWRRRQAPAPAVRDAAATE